MLNEIHQRKTNFIWSHWYAKSNKQTRKKKKNKLIRYREQNGGCQTGDGVCVK